MSRVAIASIDLDALKHNLSIVKKAAANSKILAVIKANAYGHGLLQVAQALVDVDAFAVAHFEEATKLRNAHPNKTIVLFQGFADEIELALLLSQNIQPVIHSLFQVELLEKLAEKNALDNVTVWLKIDTGMHRLGIAGEQIENCWQRLNALSGLQDNIKVLSHFANADQPDNPSNKKQSTLFANITAAFDSEKSLVNSAGLLSRAADHYQWVRPGIMLYGASPFLNKTAEQLNLKPVMTLKSRIISINVLKKGEAIGYGSCWQSEEETHIAIVGIGYGDGYPRHVDDDTPVLINGKKFPVVGRVSMDMICVNLGEKAQQNIGDEVILWGDGLPVDLIASKASTIAYELLCQITARVKYIYQSSDGNDSNGAT